MSYYCDTSIELYKVLFLLEIKLTSPEANNKQIS